MTVFRHLADKGDGRVLVDLIFTLVADATAVLDADSQALLVKGIKDFVRWGDDVHGVSLVAVQFSSSFQNGDIARRLAMMAGILSRTKSISSSVL